eukprot:6265424-Amphidinium_carterae.1
MGAPSSGGPSADEGQRQGTDLPAMSSTGQYYVTGELSPGGPSAGERQHPEAKRTKTTMEVDEAQDPARLAREQEMEEVYSRSRRTFVERDDPDRNMARPWVTIVRRT